MIGERLPEVQKDRGETQVTLAERLGVSLSTIRAWEQEKSSPNHEMLVAICRIYYVSADYLLELSDVNPGYVQRQRLEKFTKEELAELWNYEEYLIWRGGNKH